MDILFAVAHHLLILLAGRVRLRLNGFNFTERAQRRDLQAHRKPGDDGVDFVTGVFVTVLKIVEVVGEHVGDDLHAPVAMIEHHQGVGEHEDHVGQAELINRWIGHGRFEKAHHVVGEISDRPAGKHRQTFDLDRLIRFHPPLQLVHRIAGTFRNGLGAGLTVLLESHLATTATHQPTRAGADERKPPDLVTAFRRLEQEARSAVVEFLKSRHRRFVVGGQLSVNRNGVSRFCQRAEVLERWLQGCHVVPFAAVLPAHSSGAAKAVKMHGSWACGNRLLQRAAQNRSRGKSQLSRSEPSRQPRVSSQGPGPQQVQASRCERTDRGKIAALAVAERSRRDASLTKDNRGINPPPANPSGPYGTPASGILERLDRAARTPAKSETCVSRFFGDA